MNINILFTYNFWYKTIFVVVMSYLITETVGRHKTALFLNEILIFSTAILLYRYINNIKIV